jgi:phage gp16-like protein
MVFQLIEEAPGETMRVIWQELVLTIEGRYDKLNRASNKIVSQRLALAEKLRIIEVFKGDLSQLQWNYTTPKRIFPTRQLV